MKQNQKSQEANSGDILPRKGGTYEVRQVLEGTEDSTMDFRVGLGIHFIERGEGYAKAEMDILPCHLNILGVIHGGCLFTLADTTSGASAMGYGTRVTTVSGNINYLRAGKDTAKITAEAKVVKHGRTFSVCDASVFDDKGTLLVTTTMTFYHLT